MARLRDLIIILLFFKIVNRFWNIFAKNFSLSTYFYKFVIDSEILIFIYLKL